MRETQQGDCNLLCNSLCVFVFGNMPFACLEYVGVCTGDCLCHFNETVEAFDCYPFVNRFQYSLLWLPDKSRSHLSLHSWDGRYYGVNETAADISCNGIPFQVYFRDVNNVNEMTLGLRRNELIGKMTARPTFVRHVIPNGVNMSLSVFEPINSDATEINKSMCLIFIHHVVVSSRATYVRMYVCV